MEARPEGSVIELGEIATEHARESILKEAAKLLEAQYKQQWLRWRFLDEQCERLVGIEQNRQDREEAERNAEREFQQLVTAGLRRAGRALRAKRSRAVA